MCGVCKGEGTGLINKDSRRYCNLLIICRSIMLCNASGHMIVAVGDDVVP